MQVPVLHHIGQLENVRVRDHISFYGCIRAARCFKCRGFEVVIEGRVSELIDSKDLPAAGLSAVLRGADQVCRP